MVQLSATRCSRIATLWVSLVSFSAIILCVASQRVFVVVVVVVVVSLSTQSGNFLKYPHMREVNSKAFSHTISCKINNNHQCIPLTRNFHISYSKRFYGSDVTKLMITQCSSEWKRFPLISSGKATNTTRDRVAPYKAANNLYPAYNSPVIFIL
jgi:hypothetical protein